MFLIMAGHAETTAHFLDRLGHLVRTAENGVLGVALALVVGLLAWGAAALLSWLTRVVLRLVRFNEAARVLFNDRPRAGREPAVLASTLVYWLVMAIGLVFAFDAMGLSLSASLGDRIRDVLPRAATAAVLLVGGVSVAIVIGGITQRFFESTGLGGGRLRGQLVSMLFIFVVALLALEQLGFAAQFVMGIGLVFAATAGLGVALAFGLGCRELVRDFIVEYLRSLEDGPASGS